MVKKIKCPNCHARFKWTHLCRKINTYITRKYVLEYKKYKCENCGKLCDGNKHVGCDWVLGRRGWRQLGVYDG